MGVYIVMGSKSKETRNLLTAQSKCWFYSILNKIGKVLLCNKNDGKPPMTFGETFIFFWRCTSILCSFILFKLTLVFRYISGFKIFLNT